MRFFARTRNGINFSIIIFKRWLRALRKRNIIEVIGDSHSLLFQNEFFRASHVGPATAFRLSADDSTNKSKEKILKILDKLSKRQNINVLFVFGEIDCRIHIYKAHKEKHKSLDSVISMTATAYVDFLKFIRKQFPYINIMVFNIVPPGEEKNIYNYKFYPSRKIRAEISTKLNKSLKQKLSSEGIVFIDIYNKLIDKKGNRIKNFVFDDIHFNGKIIPFVMDEMKRYQILF